MTDVIIDTNFLLIPAQFGVDIFDEMERILDKPEFFIIDKTVEELESITKTADKGRDKEAAKLALGLLERYPVKHLKTEETERHLNVDNLIIKRVKAAKYVVATQDMALKHRLRQNNAQLVVLRQKKFLMLV